MSQNSRNQPGERQGNPGRGDDQQDMKRYEGFEGMNYEQRRQPFNPQQTANNQNRDEESSGRQNGDEGYN